MSLPRLKCLQLKNMMKAISTLAATVERLNQRPQPRQNIADVKNLMKAKVFGNEEEDYDGYDGPKRERRPRNGNVMAHSTF